MGIVKHGKLKFEYNLITPLIYIGSNQCCKVHFKEALLKKGIQADISLEKERLDKPFGVKYFFWIPVKDFSAPTQSQLKIGANVIRDLVDNKIKTYIHCKRGHGRSPTFVAAYLITTGMSAKKAIELIKMKRPSIHLTPGQKSALNTFEKNSKIKIRNKSHRR